MTSAEGGQGCFGFEGQHKWLVGQGLLQEPSKRPQPGFDLNVLPDYFVRELQELGFDEG